MKILDFFKFPGPKELGKSKYNYLPLRFLNPNDYCWEDYEEEIKSLYPKKYFILKTMPKFIKYKLFNPFLRPLNKIVKWFKYNLIPKYRYHVIDLRQNFKNSKDGNYRYGWIDTNKKMLYAVFNIFNDFVRNEYKYFYKPSDEEIKEDPSLLEHKELVLEIEDIHYWWNYQRIFDENKLSECNYEDYYDLLEQYDAKETEMLNRLMKIRDRLWT